LKFTSKGGRIDVTLEAEGAEAVIRVADNGSGISPEVLPHIFERFRQGSSSAARKHSGLGIGLALVRHLVEMHGGTVVGMSDGDGHGAVFTVRLPLLGPRAEQFAESLIVGEAAENSDSQPLDGLQVLVLEDDTDAREMIATTLKHAGAEVTAAGSMQDALGILDTLTPDVVVSDIAMPNGTGYDFLRHMRRVPRFLKIPAIALTAYARSQDRARALDEGFHSHIGKPVEPTSLVRTVAVAAGRS
jgi:CheY-like chemotaxis protein